MSSSTLPAPSQSHGAFTPFAWVAVAGVFTLTMFIPTLYLLSSRQPPPAYQLAAWLLNGLLFYTLLTRDRRLMGMRGLPSNFGLLLLVAWPLVVPYHLFTTRGRRGWRPVLLFAGIYLGVYALSVSVATAATILFPQ